MTSRFLAATLLASPVALAHPALAADGEIGDPVQVSDTVSIDPMLDLRIRYENVDQPTTDADAITARLRSGFEIRHAPSHLSFMVEAEGTLAIGDQYNAIPFALPGSAQRRPAYATIVDPESIDLNRLQAQYRTKTLGLTVGRQRINLDDQRFVGSVGWRQNEQTFDAVRAEAVIGPVTLDGTYAIGQNTIFGSDAGPRRAIGGDFVFLGAGTKIGSISAKAFAYLIDYDESYALANSSQTYGMRFAGSVPVSKAVQLNLAASYARQSDYGSNPSSYDADYLLGEVGMGYRGFTLTGGYEKLGADEMAARSFQTPLATLHKFNGWADLFLTTPANGLEDVYVSLAKVFPKVKGLPGLNAQVAYHSFHSDVGSVKFGSEWDASIGFKLGKIGLLAKYADYDAARFGVDKQIVWLQAEYAF